MYLLLTKPKPKKVLAKKCCAVFHSELRPRWCPLRLFFLPISLSLPLSFVLFIPENIFLNASKAIFLPSLPLAGMRIRHRLITAKTVLLPMCTHRCADDILFFGGTRMHFLHLLGAAFNPFTEVKWWNQRFKSITYIFQ